MRWSRFAGRGIDSTPRLIARGWLTPAHRARLQPLPGALGAGVTSGIGGFRCRSANGSSSRGVLDRGCGQIDLRTVSRLLRWVEAEHHCGDEEGEQCCGAGAEGDSIGRVHTCLPATVDGYRIKPTESVSRAGLEWSRRRSPSMCWHYRELRPQGPCLEVNPEGKAIQPNNSTDAKGVRRMCCRATVLWAGRSAPGVPMVAE